MNLHDYIRIIRRGWLLVALLTVVGALGGLGLAAATPPTYQALSTVYVSTVGAGTVADRAAGSAFAMQRAQTYANLAMTGTVLQRVVDSLDDGTTIADLRQNVAPVLRAETSLIDINGSGDDPEQVASWVNGVAQGLSAEVARLEAAAEQPEPGPNDEAPVNAPVVVSVVEAAEPPSVAFSPQPRYNAMVGALAGLAIGLAALVIGHALDTRIRTVSDIPRASRLATLSSIPSRRARSSRRAEARVEAFRTLRTNLQFGPGVGRSGAGRPGTGGSIAVTAVDSTGDATAVAEQLAAAIGEIGSKAVVVHLDFRPGALQRADRAGHRSTGVAEVLRGAAAVNDATIPGSAENVFVIPPGAGDQSTAQLLSTSAMRQMLDELEAQYSYVILACPPLIERSESTVAAALADSTLIVVQSAATRRAAFLYGLDLLAGVHASSVSVVLDNVRDVDPSSRGRAPEPAPSPASA
jgi:capsular polysaccharide biosynthesis protein